ncbi:MAG TPA: hypothetical protein VEC36_07635 [Patescibacteria group bacterium]|nr:hypothetical protein [Patescibacteria group bacterium]
MGFDYKILLRQADAGDKDLKEFVCKIEKQKKFTNGWPEFSIALENDGIYVCKHMDFPLWAGLEELQIFLSLKGIDYSVEEL